MTHGRNRDPDSSQKTFYTRFTPLTSITKLREDLLELENQFPNDFIWSQIQLDDLKRLETAGHSEARLYYSGMTTHSPLGREENDSTVLGESLLSHWRTVTGLDLEVYQWKELDREAYSRYDFRTDQSISGIEETIVDATGGVLHSLNQQPGGFSQRIRTTHCSNPLANYPHVSKGFSR